MPIVLALGFPETDIESWSRAYVAGDGPERVAREEGLMTLAREAGARGQLTRDVFLQIARWKSPRPSRFYEENSPELVAEVSRRSFAAANDTERALLLTELAGVNVRTATAILHLCLPTVYPLMDVWAMAALGIGTESTAAWDELDWLRAWPEYVRECMAIATRTGQSLRVVDRALWAYGKSKGRGA